MIDDEHYIWLEVLQHTLHLELTGIQVTSNTIKTGSDRILARDN